MNDQSLILRTIDYSPTPSVLIIEELSVYKYAPASNTHTNVEIYMWNFLLIRLSTMYIALIEIVQHVNEPFKLDGLNKSVQTEFG